MMDVRCTEWINVVRERQKQAYLCLNLIFISADPVEIPHISKQPHDFSTFWSSTFCIEMYRKMSNLIKSLCFAGPACTSAIHFAALV